MLKKELYVLHLSGSIIDTLHLFYSEGEYEASEQAKDLQQEHGGAILSLQCFPRGFKLATVEIPGSLMAPGE